MRIVNFFYKCLGVRYGKNLSLHGIPIIITKKRGNIVLGNNVTIKSSFLSNLIGLYQRTIIVARTTEAQIHIGNNVGISGVTIYARERIKIGNNCKIGGNTKILDNDFHPVDPELRLACSNQNMSVKSIEIGENVFIGCNCIILKGVKIGNNSTIGAGSVVVGEIPDNCIAAGNPAKIVRYLTNEGIVDRKL